MSRRLLPQPSGESVLRAVVRSLRDRDEWQAELGHAPLVAELSSYLEKCDLMLEQIEGYHRVHGPWGPGEGWSAVCSAHENVDRALGNVRSWITRNTNKQKQSSGGINQLNLLVFQVGLAIAELGCSVKFRSATLFTLATDPPLTNPHENQKENNQRQKDTFNRALPTTVALLVNELSPAANRAEFSQVSTGVDNVSVLTFLGAQIDGLKHIKIRVANPVARSQITHVDAVMAAVGEIRASAEFLSRQTARAWAANIANQSIKEAQVKLIRQTKRLKLAINLLARLCGVHLAEISAGELAILLRGVRDDPRWLGKLKQQTVVDNFKVLLNQAIGAVEEIYIRQKLAGPFDDVLPLFVEAERSVFALAQWTPDEDEREAATPAQEKLTSHQAQQLSDLLRMTRESIVQLGNHVGLDLTAKLALASVAKAAQRFGPRVAMSERRANIYGLL